MRCSENQIDWTMNRRMQDLLQMRKLKIRKRTVWKYTPIPHITRKVITSRRRILPAPVRFISGSENEKSRRRDNLMEKGFYDKRVDEI